MHEFPTLGILFLVLSFIIFFLLLTSLNNILPIYNNLQGIRQCGPGICCQFRRKLNHEWFLEDHKGNVHTFSYNMDFLNHGLPMDGPNYNFL